MTTTDFRPTISVIIPAYNEEKRIGRTLKGVTTYLEKHYKSAYEIVIVDDGSTDKTINVIQKWMTFHPEVRFHLRRLPRNLGKGAAVKVGVYSASGKCILFTDADLATPISQIPQFISQLEGGVDIVIGSRYQPKSLIKVTQPDSRRIPGRLFRYIVRNLVLRDTPISDTQCGFKCFRSDVARNLFSIAKVTGYAFDVEILYLAQRNGYSVVSIPVKWWHKEGSQFRPFLDFALMLLDVCRILVIHHLEPFSKIQLRPNAPGDKCKV